MIFAAFFILGFGLCAAEGTNTSLQDEQESADVYNNTYRAVRRKDYLHLMWHSDELEGKLTKCLRSGFIRKEKGISYRTFEVNQKQVGGSSSKQLQKNITITVLPAGAYANLEAKSYDGTEISPGWGGSHQVLNATSKCFVVRAVVTHEWKSHCAVFGLKNHSEDCIQMANQVCTNGTRVDLTQCEVKRKEKKQ